MDVCYLEHHSDASRSADLSVSDLAGHRIYGLHLVMVCWWGCVCVCVCVWERETERVSTQLISWITGQLLILLHLEDEAHVIKFWSGGNIPRDPPTCSSAVNQFVPRSEISSEKKPARCHSNTTPSVAEVVWLEYICMRRNSFREAFHHVGSLSSLALADSSFTEMIEGCMRV